MKLRRNSGRARLKRIHCPIHWVGKQGFSERGPGILLCLTSYGLAARKGVFGTGPMGFISPLNTFIESYPLRTTFKGRLCDHSGRREIRMNGQESSTKVQAR